MTNIFVADYSTGFGGKYGVQKDRVDKAAVGWEHQEHLEKHESQTGTCYLNHDKHPDGQFKWLAVLTSEHEVPRSNSAGGRIQLVTVPHIIAQGLSLSLFHHLNLT